MGEASREIAKAQDISVAAAVIERAVVEYWDRNATSLNC